MKPTHIVITDQGIGCIEAPDYEYPTHNNDWSNEEAQKHKEYKQALEAAMKNVVLFKDDGLPAEYKAEILSWREKGKLYPIPDGYEVLTKEETWTDRCRKRNCYGEGACHDSCIEAQNKEIIYSCHFSTKRNYEKDKRMV